MTPELLTKAKELETKIERAQHIRNNLLLKKEICTHYLEMVCREPLVFAAIESHLKELELEFEKL